MQVPDGTWYYGWQGSPPQPVTLNPGDMIPDQMVQAFAPDDGLLASCLASDPVSTAAALTSAQAPGATCAVAAVAVTAFIAAQPIAPVLPVVPPVPVVST